MVMVGVMIMAATSVPTSSAAPARLPALKPSRMRYVLVALLPIVALVCAVLWGYAVYETVGASTDNLVRGSVPGEITMDLHPGTWYIYAEGSATVQSIRVTDQDGQPVAVKPSSAGTYDRGGSQARAVGQFEVKPGPSAGGVHRIAVTGTGTGDPPGDFAVGTFSVNGFMQPQLWGIGALLLVNVGSAIAIAVVPIIRARRRTAAANAAAA